MCKILLKNLILTEILLWNIVIVMNYCTFHILSERVVSQDC